MLSHIRQRTAQLFHKHSPKCVVLRSRKPGVQNGQACCSAEPRGRGVRGPRIPPLLCDLNKVISLPLSSDGKKAELNGRLNPALTFYSSKIKFGFHKAAHLDIRTGLVKGELCSGPFPLFFPPFLLPSIPSFHQETVTKYLYVSGTVREQGVLWTCVPHPTPNSYVEALRHTGRYLEMGPSGSE